MREQRTEAERWQEQLALHRQLCKTVRTIMDRWRGLALGPGVQTEAEAAWYANYSAVQTPLEGETGAESYKRVQKWLKLNKPRGACAEFLKWERAYFAITNCGKEWIGYRAACCGDKTPTVAVPIGCNHRLCPLCAWHRSQRARVRVKTMYDRLSHPAMITFTVPNLAGIRKHTFTRFRQMVRQWAAQRKDTLQGQGWPGMDATNAVIKGGVYSIETTYSRERKDWHVHAHMLADLGASLPSTRDRKIEFFGEKVFPFVALKWRMEFDWLQLTSTAWGKRPKNECPKKSAKSIRKWCASWDNYWTTFHRWVLDKRAHSTAWAKEYNVLTGKMQLRADLGAADVARVRALEAWNKRNTRVFDVRPVLDRDGAAREVLKYITKVADFGDMPDAVEMFCNATRGARLVQTFGSWYGFNLETQFDPERLEDWGERKCACGLNEWERMGVFHAHDVCMDEAGRWHLKRSFNSDSRGTVARPTIRALEARETEDMHTWEAR